MNPIVINMTKPDLCHTDLDAGGHTGDRTCMDGAVPH